MPHQPLIHTSDISVCGIDEAGRGPWAGPVVASAVILNPEAAIEGVNDSKKLTVKKREVLFEQILATCQVGIGLSSAEEIDSLNILQATMLAMQRAYADLGKIAGLALIDGNRAPTLPCKTQTVVSGDATYACIAAASIIAKVTRDRIMNELHQQYPNYGWAQNAGYGTRAHQDGLAAHGITPYHRTSFAPIRAILEKSKEAA